MSGEENKRTVNRYLDEVWNRGRITESAGFLDPGYRRHTGDPVPLDVEGQRIRLESFRKAFPDVGLVVEEMIAEGDLVAFRFTLSGTHRGTFQGIAATGRRVRVPGLDLVRLKDGRLTEHWGGADLNALKAQLS